MKKTIITLAITGSLAITGVVAVAAQNSSKKDILSSQEISKKALSYVKGEVYQVELDHEKSGPVYEVDVKDTKAQYELKLDAKTGELLKKSTEYNATKTVENKMIDLEEAKKIALKAVDGEITAARLDDEDNVYEVEVRSGEYDYEFEIDTTTGDIIKKQKETRIQHLTSTGKTTISLEKAKETALSKVSGTVTSANYDQEDGVYEISINAKGYEYDFDIHDQTGKIIKQEQERVKNDISNNDPTVISSKEASKIALSKAKGTVTKIDLEDGIYEIEVKDGTYEYEIEIDAKTSDILNFEKDYED